MMSRGGMNIKFSLAAVLFLLLSFAALPVAASTSSVTSGDRQPGPSTPVRVWDQTFGGVGDDVGYAVVEKGGYVIAASTATAAADASDVTLLKTNALGRRLWQRTFLGPSNYGGRSLARTRDGGYVVGGGKVGADALMNWDDFRVIKTNPAGVAAWDKTFEGANAYVSAITQTSDGGYAMLAARDIPNPHYFRLFKTNASGVKQWEKSFYGSGPSYAGRSIVEARDGGLVFLASTLSGPSGFQFWFTKTDALGNVIWQRTFGVANSSGISFAPTSDGGYILSGGYGVYGDGSVPLVKTDANGNPVWQKALGGNGRGECVIQTSDGGFLVVGRTNHRGAGGWDVWVIKTDGSGNWQWDQTWGGPADDMGFGVIETSGRGYLVVGSTKSYGAGGSDIWLVKLK